MKAFLIAASAATLVAGCATTTDAVYDPPVTADPNSLTSAPGYMRMAASSDMFEIQSSQLALQMSQNPTVQQFAQMMINDHTRTSTEMMQLAQSLGMPAPPQTMAPHHREMLNRLQAASPADFDRMYKAEQLAAHQEALNLHRTYAAQGDTQALQEFAARVVPAIEMHYQHAQGLPETTAMPMQTQPQPMQAGERG